MATEDISARFLDLDAWATADAVEAMFEGQLSAVAAVRPALPAISAAADAAATALGASGRLVYLGAGTSGRIGVQDGAELTPTFDWPTARMVFAMAGGMDALVTSIEGAEDDEADAIARIDALKLGPHDVSSASPPVAPRRSPWPASSARGRAARSPLASPTIPAHLC